MSRIRTRLNKLEAAAPEEPRPRYAIAVLDEDEQLDEAAYPDDLVVLVVRCEGETPHVE